MKPASNPTALRVQAALGESYQVLEFDASTRTASDAAAAVGCTVGQIAKSIIFKAASGRPVLVVASGDNRVATDKVAAAIGEKIGRADATFVRDRTGYAIGGVPPLAHAEPVITLIDQDLARFDRIWAAAGTPNAVFALTYADLVALTCGTVADIAER